MIYKRFSPKQNQAMLWWLTGKEDGIICDGAVRSGKTVSMTLGFVLWSMTEFEGETFALCGHTVESLRRNVVRHLPQWLEGVFRVEEKRSENRITLRWGERSNSYYLFGGRDESSYALIQGITLAGVLLDEVALMPRSFVEQAVARCSVAGSKFWFNCNPGSPNHWFYREWIQQAHLRNVRYLHFTMEDNPDLDSRVRRRYEGLYTGAFYDRYIRGIWRSAEGVVYDMFDEERHIRTKAPADSPCWVSVDYGTQNPTVFLLWESDGEGWHCRKEYYWSGREERRQKTDGDYAGDLEAFLEGRRPRAVVVDPSAASFIAQLRRRGFKVLGADTRVGDGIRGVGELLQSGKLTFQPECTHTRREFGAYVWDEGAAQRGEDSPRKEHDHCMDAVRYFVMTVVIRGRGRVVRRPTWG